jgi:hypothetical protein
MFCESKNIFGSPNQGVHHYRFLGLAIVDVVFTIVGAFLISLAIKKPFWMVLLFLFLLGIVLHRVFCVRTRIDTLLFPNAT